MQTDTVTARTLLRWARKRAKKKLVPYSLEVEDIADVYVPSFCPILGIPLKSLAGRGSNPYSPTIDRKDPAKGYVRGNVWVISALANRMKSDATPEQLRRFAEWVMRTYPGVPTGILNFES